MVAGTHQGGDDSDIGAVPRGEEDTGLLPFEQGELRFEFAMNIEDSAQDRPSGGAQPVFAYRFDHRVFGDRGGCQAEIVVRREVKQVVGKAILIPLDRNTGFRSGKHGFLVEMVAIWQGVRVPPVIKWMQEIVNVLTCTVEEVAQVIIARSNEAALRHLGNVSFRRFGKALGNGQQSRTLARLATVCSRQRRERRWRAFLRRCFYPNGRPSAEPLANGQENRWQWRILRQIPFDNRREARLLCVH